MKLYTFFDHYVGENCYFRNLREAEKAARGSVWSGGTATTVYRITLADLPAKELAVRLANGAGFVDESEAIVTLEPMRLIEAYTDAEHWLVRRVPCIPD